MTRRGVPLSDALTLGTLLAVVYAGKRFYAGAGAEDLGWVLGPTATLTGWLVGGRFVHEAAYGWVDGRLGFAIVPACAGVNFLLVAFGVLGCVLALGEQHLGRRLGRLAVAGMLSYALTLGANTVRLALAVAWHASRPDLGWLTEARWHRIEGVAVYVAALLAAHELAAAWRRRVDREATA